MLRPQHWAIEQGMLPGRQIRLVLAELDVNGVATIQSVSPCPPIVSGDGHVVTGRFVTRHIGNLVRLTLSDGTTIRVTSIHPFWSADRQDWVSADELREGEQLDGIDGPAYVESIEGIGHYPAVYNLEVHGHHVYRVADVGVLVHNAGPCGVNLNLDEAVSNFGIYEIKIFGSLFKIGKADLSRVTHSSGLPTRLHQQIRTLEKIFGKGNVMGEVVVDLGETTTRFAKAAEHQRILNSFLETGFIPILNLKSFRL